MAISAIEGRLSRRTRLLLATSMTAMALGSASTQANEWTLSGFPTVDVGAGNPVFGVVAGNIDLDVKIDTPTATLLTGVFTASLNGEVTTTVSQEIDAAFWGIYQSNLAADMTIDGTGGSIIANEGIATFSQGTTKIDGFTSITTDAFRGIVSNFGWVGAGAVEIGQATRIGTITAATNGIEAYSTGVNAIAIDASTINAGQRCGMVGYLCRRHRHG